MKTAGVILVTDPRQRLARTLEVVRLAARALGPGGLAVQLRDKESPIEIVTEAARRLREVTRDEGALLLINGPLAIALDVGADGVHFPAGGLLTDRIAEGRRSLGPSAVFTTAAHDDDDVRAAALAGASAVLVSPIFATPGKGSPRGTTAIAAARAIVDAARRSPPMLVYALGGVTRENVAACLQAGADGAAVIRALYSDPSAAASLRCR